MRKWWQFSFLDELFLHLPERYGADRLRARSRFHPSSCCSRLERFPAVCCASPESSPLTSSYWCTDEPLWTLHQWDLHPHAAETKHRQRKKEREIIEVREEGKLKEEENKKQGWRDKILKEKNTINLHTYIKAKEANAATILFIYAFLP